jgi:Zn-dependent protease
MDKINFTLFFGHLAVYLFVWVFAITTQGALTAWMSNYYGDDTAKNQGRISFSPFAQADLLGTIILPAIAFTIGWMSPGIPFIAWGKRVPIDAEKWKNPKLAGVMVTLASTFASILIALASFILLKTLLATGIADTNGFLQVVFGKNTATNISWLAPVEIVLWYSLAINLVLALFSLIPFPPFNGGVVLLKLFPESFKPVADFLNRFGLLIAILLIYLVGIKYIFTPILIAVLRILIN